MSEVTITTVTPNTVATGSDATEPRRVSRRFALIAAFWAGIGALAAGAAGTVLNSLYPRNVGGFGGPITVPAARIPAPGDDPRPIVEGRFLLVNLAAGEGLMPGDESQTSGGLVALYRKCPHLGCSVPWRSDASYKGTRGVFLCPCHGSTYTRAGVRVFGPAPRSMDTMPIEAGKSGDIVVQTGEIEQGGIDNASRAVAYTPPSPTSNAPRT
jgi:cytochrome b6-f complex iron-sulfur subunit